ncbi:Xyloglucan 6-xylosyltransferase 2 [Hibiscus syriacus]|uniref:Xyloglucan 6-xylosyltransferase 2 n=1 Tax=Hibiscus syriacus TaxID=106335 RepID=A0A6A3CNV4_HIBSY|nr:Xyloglucan 6-xylosyltransferase 2 [Hibiscus syriacus]
MAEGIVDFPECLVGGNAQVDFSECVVDFPKFPVAEDHNSLRLGYDPRLARHNRRREFGELRSASHQPKSDRRNQPDPSRMLLVTGSPPKPCDNPIGDHYLFKAIKNRIDYCRLHGIEIIYNMAHLDTKLASYWAELPLIIRNCQWSLDLLDAWQPMGPKGPIRDEAEKDQWMDKVFIENQYYLHGYWAGLVDRYEKMMKKYHPGLREERWPVVTHFAGCKRCESYGDYSVDRCLRNMQRAFNFADN